ncbi:hypothetical protein SAMN05444274_105179 [Mariniphaga anaerophila]|uniref:Uncharacterized protein n=1 Tax=Mariniphaga anaerophila TaxID=1484053 RepID=A0A1M5BJW0_9BACT|nr:hypothetical protein SAMN05444274_105179 [Mariniphaga anaerophila]
METTGGIPTLQKRQRGLSKMWVTVGNLCFSSKEKHKTNTTNTQTIKDINTTFKI